MRRYFLILVILVVGILSFGKITLNETLSASQGSPPVANADSYTGHLDIDTIFMQPSGGVLANDYDPDGGIFNAVYQNFQTSLGNGTIWANGRLQFSSVPPHNGTVVVPYEVCDAEGCTSSTVTLTLVNHAPTANSDTYTFHGDFDTLSSGVPGLLANDSDSDGDGIIVLGDLFRTPLGNATLDSTGRAGFAPSTGETGSVTIPYTICDGYQECTQSTVTFNSVNQKPIAASDFYVVGDEGIITLSNQPPNLLANDSDP